MEDSSAALDRLLTTSALLTRSEVYSRPCPIPAAPGVYAWWFDEVPPDVPTEGCVRRGNAVLLYAGISPKAPPLNGRPASSQTVRSRVKYHFNGNAEGSTLRLTLGVLLGEALGIELRRVGSGNRRTFHDGERPLTDWIARSARVSVLEHASPWELEAQLIMSVNLPLNLDQNRAHGFHSTLSERRSAARQRAAALPIIAGSAHAAEATAS